MKRLSWVLAAAMVTTLAAQDDCKKATKCRGCGNDNFGTTIQWAGDPQTAAKKAEKEEKLVFVLHVSGYFEDPKFT